MSEGEGVRGKAAAAGERSHGAGGAHLMCSYCQTTGFCDSGRSRIALRSLGFFRTILKVGHSFKMVGHKKVV